MQNILQTAAANGSFKTLLAAIETAGLTSTLNGAGPFTVFAPTDAAFAKIPETTLKTVLADKTKLASILTYHVIPGKVLSKEVSAMTEAKTVQGSSVAIQAKHDVMINNAKVTAADIECSNGVIHIIDTVLMPQS